jgi:hypothetical protein
MKSILDAHDGGQECASYSGVVIDVSSLQESVRDPPSGVALQRRG